MSLFYKEKQDSKPNKDGKKMWHPVLVKTGKMVSTQKIGEMIAVRTSMHTSDTHAVVRCLTEVMREVLLNSQSVRLDGLGTFTFIAHSNGTGVETADKVKPEQITRLKCRFTPEYTRNSFEGTTRAMFQGVDFIHVSKMNSKSTSDGGAGGDEEDDFIDPTT